MLFQKFHSGLSTQIKSIQLFKSLTPRFFSSSYPDIPVINISTMKNDISECKRAVSSFEKYGIMIIKDERVSQQKNSDFIDLMEKYYEDVSGQFYRGENLSDVRPESSHNIGVVPEGYEKARNHSQTIEKKFSNDRPLTSQPPQFDKKWRFAWSIDASDEASYKVNSNISGDNVIPKNFPEWSQTMNGWGELMKNSVTDSAEMLARGYEINPDFFTKKDAGCQPPFSSYRFRSQQIWKYW